MSTEEEYRALRDGIGAYRLPRDVLSVAGPDAADYLQGQLSQDLAPLAVGQSADTLVLAPDGKLEALARVVRVDEEVFHLDVDGGHGPALLGRLARFKLRSRLDLQALDWVCVALRGAGLAGSAAPGAPVVAPVEWNGWRGVDLLGPEDSFSLPDAARWCSAPAWEAARIESGVPVMGRELSEGVIPAETGTVDRAVSFTKGCFTGQELVARMESRGGAPPNRLVGLVLGPDAGGAPAGTELFVEGRERPVGRVTSSAWCFGLGAWGALAFLHRSVAVEETVHLGPPGHRDSTAARATTLPLI